MMNRLMKTNAMVNSAAASTHINFEWKFEYIFHD